MREITLRLFAGELQLLKKRREESPAPTAGDTVKNLYICGVLTDVKKDPSGIVRSARVADPTGVFLINCRKDRAYCSSEFLKMNIPSFVSVFGDISEDRQGGKEIVINPQSVREISREMRDIWITGTAASAIERLEKSSAGCNESSESEYNNCDYEEELIGIVKTA